MIARILQATCLCLCLLLSLALIQPSHAEPQLKVQEVSEVRITTISVQDTCARNQLRQIEEKKRLLHRLEKRYGKWEKRHPRWRLLEALYAYHSHQGLALQDVDRWRALYKSTTKEQKKLLERLVKYTAKLNKNDHLMQANGKLHDRIVQHAMDFYEVAPSELDAFIKEAQKEKRGPEKMSVGQASKHFVRDWSAEGDAERQQAFPCILNCLLETFPNRTADAVKVLLPGSGLGRLGHDVHSLGGFEVTLNEWSVYMILAYRYIDSLRLPGSDGLHPFVDGWSHHATTADMQRRVLIPDHPVEPDSVLLVEGDFLTAFKGQVSTFDSVVTHYFIDTARNLLAYFETIHQLLKPGGVWVNFGPLLYGTGPFVQLSLDEIILVVEEMGFEFMDLDNTCGQITLKGHKVRGKRSSYDFNAKALTNNAYKAQSWAVRKVR